MDNLISVTPCAYEVDKNFTNLIVKFLYQNKLFKGKVPHITPVLHYLYLMKFNKIKNTFTFS